MKILVVVPTAHGGGAEFVAMTWARNLVERGHRLGVFTTARSTRPEGVPDGVDWFGPNSGAGHIGIQRALRRVQRSERPDVVLALQQYPNLHAVVGRMGFRRAPVVISERNLVSIGKSRQGFNHRAKVALAQTLYRRADRTVAISHAVAADLISSFGVDPSRCTVVPNPALAKVEAVRAAGIEMTDAVLDAGAPDETVMVLACRLVQQKRPMLAVDAAAELVRRGRPVRLILFGGGALHDDVVAHAESAGVVVDDRGWAENWFAEIPKGAVHVLPSDQEGLANTLIEAAGAGIRSVAYSRALGVSDALLPGLTGVLVREDGPEVLADAIESQRGLDVHGVGAWLDQFSAGRSSTELERLLLDVVGHEPPRATAVQIGGAGNIAGGLSQVVRSLSAGTVPGFRVLSRPTRSVDSSATTVHRTMKSAVSIAIRSPLRHKTVIAVHLSQGGSFFREGALAILGSTLGFPVVAHLHGSTFAAFAESNPRLVASVLRRTSGVLTLSEETTEAVVGLVPESKVVQLPNCVDIPMTLPPKDNVVVFGGRVGHRKGVDVLLEAWGSLDTTGWKLVAAGPIDPEFDLQVKNSDSTIEFVGSIPHEELLSILRSSALAVLPSRAEALPLFLLEAMAAGNAVVASDVGGIAELVDDSVGALIQPGDTASLVGALKRLLGDPQARAAAGSRARARAAARYGTDICHPLVAEVWRSALELKGAVR